MYILQALAEASGLGGIAKWEGRGLQILYPRFKSGCRLHAQLAQWLECLLDMQEVAGSSPALGTSNNKYG